MRIGYIILCHKEPMLVAKIINRVTNGTENIAVVHVDAKSDLYPFKTGFEKNEQVVFLDKRTAIYWGGFSSIIATMDALQVALSYGCERYVLLQGADYPLHSNEYINDFFEMHRGVEFLKAYNITRSKRKCSYMKCYGYHMFDGVDRSKKCLKTLVARGLQAINMLGIKYMRGYYLDKESYKKYEIYWGWAHFALTKECVEYILSVYYTNKAFNKYFKHKFPPDETYIQTIIYNSKFINKTVDAGPVDEMTHMTVKSMLNLTYFEYPVYVTVMENISQLDNIDKKEYLYVRKISGNKDFLSALNRSIYK